MANQQPKISALQAVKEYLRNIPSFELRNRHLIVWDILVQPVLIFFALLIRLETVKFGQYRDSAFHYGILSALIVPSVFYLMGMYRRFWRYASLREAELIVISSIVAELLQAFLYIIILTLLHLVDRSLFDPNHQYVAANHCRDTAQVHDASFRDA